MDIWKSVYIHSSSSTLLRKRVEGNNMGRDEKEKQPEKSYQTSWTMPCRFFYDMIIIEKDLLNKTLSICFVNMGTWEIEYMTVQWERKGRKGAPAFDVVENPVRDWKMIFPCGEGEWMGKWPELFHWLFMCCRICFFFCCFVQHFKHE